MSPLTSHFFFARTVAIATLTGSTLLVSPLILARANPAADPPTQSAQDATGH